MTTLKPLLIDNGYDQLVDDWPGENIDRAVVKSKLLRLFHADVTFETLWRRDELYNHWYRYFTRIFTERDTPSNDAERPQSALTDDGLEKSLETVRQLLSER